MTMLSKAALKMIEPKVGYGGFSEEVAVLPKKRARTQAVTPEIDYNAPQMGTSRATVVKLEHPKELKPPASVTDKPKGKGKASGAAPAPALARAQPLAKKTEKAERTVAEAADSETVAALKAKLAKQEAVLVTTRTERDAFQQSSQLNSSLAEAREEEKQALEEEKQHLEENNVAKDKTIKKLQGLLTDQGKANVELKRRLEVCQAAGARVVKKLDAANAKLASLGKRKRDDDDEELSEGEIDEDEGDEEEEEEDSGDDSGDDPTYDEEEGREQEEEDDDEEEEEAEQERAVTVFAKHNSSKRQKASSSGDEGGKPGKRRGGRLGKEDKIKYDRPSTAFEACGGLPVHNIKEIPYLREKKPNNLPAWKTQEEMVAWVRLEYQNEDKKDSHAPGMVEDMLDLFAVPNTGSTYYADKDFPAFIKYFATWSLPESEGKTGLSGGRHFMATLLYPDFFKPNRASFIRHKFKDTYEQKKFLALREKVNKYWGCIWWWNKHLKLGHPQRKVN